MSTTKTQSAFAPAVEESRALPKLNCIGYLGTIGEPTASKGDPANGKPAGQYIVQPIRIEPTAGGKTGFINFLYRSEWLQPDFDPNSLKSSENSAFFIVYKMNINSTQGLSVLAGIAGSEENFNLLATRLQSEVTGLTDDSEVASKVYTVLSEFAADVNPEVGYYSIQKKEKQYNSETGKYEKVAVPGKREIGGYFWPGEESNKRNKADAAKGNSVMAYEAD